MAGDTGRGGLEDSPFSYRVSKDGKVFVSWRGRQVKTLAGRQARSFVARIEAMDAGEQQLEMARVTGNFKRGNERR